MGREGRNLHGDGLKVLCRLLNIAGITTGLAGLVLQFGLTIPASLDAGRSLPGSIVYFFSFFTILTNIAAVLVHAASFGTFGLRFFARPRVRAGIVAAMAVVGLVYFFLLADLWHPVGPWFVADIILHYGTPPLILAWWLACGRDGTLARSDPFRFISYPIAYLAYALARAPVAGEVPYPFLDFDAYGWGKVAEASLGITALFLVLGFALVLADRMLPQP